METKPLEGLRIIDMSTYVAGPSGGMTLAQLGADVIRIDPTGGATDTRRLPLDRNGRSLYWAGLNAGKRSVEINTREERGQDLVRQLIATPGPGNGIVMTNAVGQHWLEYDELRAYREDLILVQITGRSDGTPAVDYTVNCEVGLPLLTGPVDAPPVNHVLPAWDLLCGQQAALAILAAERVRTRTGKGQHVTISLAEMAVATMAHLGFVADVVVNGHARSRDGNFMYGSYGHNFRTADDRHVMIVALTPRHWRHLVKMAGIEEAVTALETALRVDFADEESRFEHRGLITALIAPWFEKHTLAQAGAQLDKNQVLWGAYRTIEELVHDPQSVMNTSTLMADVVHPGIGSFPSPRPVLDFVGDSRFDPSVSPTLGGDTDEVLREIAGLSDDDLLDLRASGILGKP